jgi:hypothetical protein
VSEPLAQPQHRALHESRHPRALVAAKRQLFGGGVEVVRCRFDAGISLHQLKNVEQVSAQVLQLELAAFTGANVLKRLFDEA